MTDKKIMYQHWLESAIRNRKSALDMIKSKHYDWGLFVWQLVIEKVLKANIEKQGKTVPYIHSLPQLCKAGGIQITDEEFDQLQEITSFNTEARYMEDKSEFYKIATKEYAAKWSDICQKYYDKFIKII